MKASSRSNRILERPRLRGCFWLQVPLLWVANRVAVETAGRRSNWTWPLIALSSVVLVLLVNVVLTATGGWGPPPVVPAGQWKQLWDTWNQMHERVAALSSRGVNFVVRGSGHYIQFDRPADVISAVDEVVEE